MTPVFVLLVKIPPMYVPVDVFILYIPLLGPGETPVMRAMSMPPKLLRATIVLIKLLLVAVVRAFARVPLVMSAAECVCVAAA
jgi:hypothetical protein